MMIFILNIAVLAGLFTVLSGMLLTAERLLINYGVCEVDVNDGEKQIEMEGGDSLLNVLTYNELFIPSACGGRGSCGHCKLTVLSGGGGLLPTEIPYLSRMEKRTGVRLACQVKVRENMKIHVPEEYLYVQKFSAEASAARMLTSDIREIRMKLLEPDQLDFRPGQYVQVDVPAGGEPVSRAYSISNPEYENGEVELIVRLVPEGLGSTYLHSVQPGDPVSLTGPFGEFKLNEDPEVELICVGGGCGMAPMKSIIYSVLKRQPERSVKFFFGCRTTSDIFYLEEFRKLEEKHPGLKVVYALSDLQPDEDWDGETGFIHLSVDKFLEPGKKRQAFLCGPPPMIEAVTEVLQEKGMSPSDWFYDEF